MNNTDQESLPPPLMRMSGLQREIIEPMSHHQPQNSELSLLLKFLIDKDEKDRAERVQYERGRLQEEGKKEADRLKLE